MVGRWAMLVRRISRLRNEHTLFVRFHEGGTRVMPGFVGVIPRRKGKRTGSMYEFVFNDGRRRCVYDQASVRCMTEWVTPKRMKKEPKVIEGV